MGRTTDGAAAGLRPQSREGAMLSQRAKAYVDLLVEASFKPDFDPWKVFADAGLVRRGAMITAAIRAKEREGYAVRRSVRRLSEAAEEAASTLVRRPGYRLKPVRHEAKWEDRD